MKETELPEYAVETVLHEALDNFVDDMDERGNMYELVSTHNIVPMVLRENHGAANRVTIAKNFIFVLQQLMEVDPGISRLAATILDYQIHVELGFDSRECSSEELIAFMSGLNIPDFLVEKHFDEMLYLLNHTEPPAFEYLGLRILYDRYLRRDERGRLLETPAMLFLRVAMGVAGGSHNGQQPLHKWQNQVALNIGKYYRLMASFRYMPSTPTLFNAGTDIPQLASCFLTQVQDNLHGIFGAIHENAMLSKFAGGLGNAWSSVRGSNAHIRGTNGQSSGVVPFLNVADATAVAVNQGGKRKGAVCAYLEPWHIDIEDFIDLRKNTGDERRRTPDMHTALWIPAGNLRRAVQRCLLQGHRALQSGRYTQLQGGKCAQIVDYHPAAPV